MIPETIPTKKPYQFVSRIQKGRRDMSRTTLTIGMAHHSDPDGVFFTLQSIRLYHPEVRDRVELIVVDNSPGKDRGGQIRDLVEGRMKRFFRDARYIPMTTGNGTSQPRNRVFAESATDAVMCVDCHVLLAPGALARLLNFYDQNPDCMDLLSGPLVNDWANFAPGVPNYWSHFDDVWDGHMWGKWGTAWKCPTCGMMFSPVQKGDVCEHRLLDGDGSTVFDACSCRHKPSPGMPWHGHEKLLESAGYVRPADDVNAEPFDIPAMGLGLFTCRRDAWLGFNEHFRGFGGEEFYIHEKYRQSGRRNLCLPSLRWLHRFMRSGTGYANRLEDRVRNYIIGHRELKLDLGRLKDHFLTFTGPQHKPIPQDTWDAIAADPIAFGQSGGHKGTGCQSCRKEIESLNIDQAFDFYVGRPDLAKDFGEHFPKLREFATQCDHVTEFGSRDYGVIPLLAGKPKVLRSYNSQADGAAFWKAETAGKKEGVKVTITHEPCSEVEIEETDLLFYDPPEHAGKRLFDDLHRNAGNIRRFIAVHDTEIYGRRGPNGQEGLKVGLIMFMKAHPEWTVVYSTTKQYGLMVMSKDPDDKPKRPSIVKMGPTFIKHLAEHVADGAKQVEPEQLERRLETCTLCDLRTKDDECSLCGCPILKKAAWRSSRCDANKWDANEDGLPEDSLEERYNVLVSTPSDINQHLPKLRELALECDHVVEFGTRRGVSSVAILAAQPKSFVTYDIRDHGIVADLERISGDCEFTFVKADTREVSITPTDMLFIDTLHQGEQLSVELQQAKLVRKYIVMHDTVTFGRTGEGGGTGLQTAIDEFLAVNPEWQVNYVSEENNGLTVLKRINQ